MSFPLIASDSEAIQYSPQQESWIASSLARLAMTGHSYLFRPA